MKYLLTYYIDYVFLRIKSNRCCYLQKVGNPIMYGHKYHTNCLLPPDIQKT